MVSQDRVFCPHVKNGYLMSLDVNFEKHLGASFPTTLSKINLSWKAFSIQKVHSSFPSSWSVKSQFRATRKLLTSNGPTGESIKCLDYSLRFVERFSVYKTVTETYLVNSLCQNEVVFISNRRYRLPLANAQRSPYHVPTTEKAFTS